MTAESAWELAYQRFETPEQERRKFIRRLLSLGVDRWDRRASVLEVCSGRGNGLVAWRQLGFRNVTGVDLSPALVEASELRRSCIVGDARWLPIRTASRDIAIVQGGCTIYRTSTMWEPRLPRCIVCSSPTAESSSSSRA